MSFKQIYLLWCCLCIALIANAQTTYSKLYNSTYASFAKDIFVEDSVIVMLGSTYVPAPDSNSWAGLLFRRLDFEGNVLTEKYYGKADTTLYVNRVGGALVRLNDGSYIVGGTAQFFDTVTHYITGSHMMLYKFNGMGDTVWTRHYPGPGLSYGNYSTVKADSTILIVGETGDFAGTFQDFYFVHTDSSGNIMSEQVYDFEQYDLLALDVEAYSNGNYLVGGLYDHNYYFEEGHGLLIKFDSTDNILQSTSYGSENGDDAGLIICISNDEKYIYAVQAMDTIITADETTRPYYIAKLDTAGNFLWRFFITHPLEMDIANIYETSDENIIITGFKSQLPYNTPHAFISKIDSNGILQWEHIYYTREDRSNYLIDSKEMPDGGYLFTGSAYSALNSQDMWLLRVDCMGCLEPGCLGPLPYVCDSLVHETPDDTSGVDTTINITTLFDVTTFTIAPNPFTNTAIVTIKLPTILNIQQNERLNLDIYDLNGKLVDRYGNIPLYNGNETIRFTINRNALMSGMYFAQLRYGATLLASTKLAVE